MKKIIGTFLTSLLSVVVVLGFIPAVSADYLREPVSEQERGRFPNSLTYAWNITKGDGRVMRCTGTYIGDRLFLSAGHCVTTRDGDSKKTKSAEAESNGSTHPVNFKMYKKNFLSKNPFKPMPGYSGFTDLKNDVSITTVTEPKTINLDTSNVRLAVYSDLQQLVGKEVTTVGYSNYFYGDLTKTSGRVLAVEADGTLTVDFYVAEQNSGSAVYLNGEIIGILTATADIEECRGSAMCKLATVTPFTKDIKAKLFDPNGVNVLVH